MKRRAFLKRVGLALLVPYLFRGTPPASAEVVDGGMLEFGIVRDSVLNATNDFQIFGGRWPVTASGGLCAPIAPYYDLVEISTVCDHEPVGGECVHCGTPIPF